MLLPKIALLRRADTVTTIGEALEARHLGGCRRGEVAQQAGVHMDTLRGWLRRFAVRAEEVRVLFTRLAHEWDPEQPPVAARESPALDALEAIGLTAQAAARHFGAADTEPRWQLVAGASAGHLLCNTSCLFPRPP